MTPILSSAARPRPSSGKENTGDGNGESAAEDNKPAPRPNRAREDVICLRGSSSGLCGVLCGGFGSGDLMWLLRQIMLVLMIGRHGLRFARIHPWVFSPGVGAGLR